jgi:hypothetical protein
VLLPFTGTLMFAVVICVTTAPLRDRLLKLCRGRSHLAALADVAAAGTAAGRCRWPALRTLAEGVESAMRYLRPMLESGLPPEPPNGWPNSRSSAPASTTTGTS